MSYYSSLDLDWSEKMHRNIITNYNDSWIVGHRETLSPTRKTEADTWERALHSDWVYAFQNEHRDPVPTTEEVRIECPVGIYPIDMESIITYQPLTVQSNVDTV